MTAPEFKHRQNADETWDSICLHCFATIATAEQEEGLTHPEDAHNCWFPLAEEKVH
jgi:hypothetical protein